MSKIDVFHLFFSYFFWYNMVGEFCMEKRDKKIIIIVSIVAISVSFLFFLFSFMKSAFDITNYINNAKADKIVLDAEKAVYLVSDVVLINGMDKDKYTLEDIDKLENMSTNKTNYYSEKYKKLNVKVIYDDDTFTYSVCIIDNNGNGFGYTNIDDLTNEKVLEKNNNIRCD